MWVETDADTDAAFDPVSGLVFYCTSIGFKCILHKTSLDQCYDEEILTLVGGKYIIISRLIMQSYRKQDIYTKMVKVADSW